MKIWTMCTFKVIDFINAHRRYPDAGAALYEEIVKVIDSDEKIIIDGKNAEGIPTLFLNTSIGRLFEVYGYERLKGRISFINLSKFETETLRKYISHYISKTV